MKLIFALGNPGQHYVGTRHNVGVAAIDHIAAQHSATFSDKSKFKSAIAQISISDEKVLLVKPLTFYNLSGEAVAAVANFYSAEPANILIIHDELMLPFGTVRTRLGGSDAGNNGIKSLNAHLGSDTARIRIGVYSDKRDLQPDADFVLSRFTAGEQELLPKIYETTQSLVESFVGGEFNPHTIRHLLETTEQTDTL